MKRILLGDALELLVDNRGKNPPFVASGVPIVTAMSVRDGVLDLTESRFVSDQTWSEWMPAPLRKRDVLLTSEAPLGRVALVRANDPILPTQRIFALRGKEGILDCRYLYYSMQTEQFQAQLRGRATGTTVVGIRQPALRSVELHLPTYEVQRAIAEVLGALDDKIAANVKLVSLAREVQHELFRLVEFDHSDCQSLADLVEVTKGVSYRRADLADVSDTAMVSLKSITRTGTYSTDGLKPFVGEYRAVQRVLPGEIVVAQTDLTQAAEVVGRAVRVPSSDRFDTLVASLDLAIVRPKPNVEAELLLGLLRDYRFRAHCLERTSGTTVLHLAPKAIEQYEFPRMRIESVSNYVQRVRPLLDVVDQYLAESESLAELRDTLLPQLMSGRLRVKDAVKHVEAVV